jgi:hypothetical protein
MEQRSSSRINEQQGMVYKQHTNAHDIHPGNCMGNKGVVI